MGKRKAARKPMKKTKEILSKEFNCLFCNHENTITVKIDKEHRVGHLQCRACGVSFQTVTTSLSAAVDVYADWVDACEGVQQHEKQTDPRQQQSSSRPAPIDHSDDEDEEEEDHADLGLDDDDDEDD